MKIQLSNFGPVRGKQDYEIDLSKNFTLITGGNGYGKTYLGYIIYVFLRYLQYGERNIRPSISIEVPYKTLKSGNIEATITEELFNSFLDHILNLFYKALPAKMAASPESFMDLNIHIKESGLYKNFIDSNVTSIDDNNEVPLQKSAAKNTFLVRTEDEINRFKKDPLSFVFFATWNQFITFGELPKTYYLPVERASISTFSKELSRNRMEVINEMSRIASEQSEINAIEYLQKRVYRYPTPVFDSLEQALDLSQSSKQTGSSPYVELADEIEQEILGGNVGVNAEGDIEFTPQGIKHKKVSIQLSASSIKTVSSLVFYLRHQAYKHDFLMIDEPEMNLHPNMQIKIARILAKISNAGIKLWVSTHSDYIISEINNLCLAGALKQKGLETEVAEWGYSNDLFLEKDKMQVLYFDDKKARTQIKIRNIEVKDRGVDIESIDDTLYQLNKRTDELNELYDNM